MLFGSISSRTATVMAGLSSVAGSKCAGLCGLPSLFHLKKRSVEEKKRKILTIKRLGRLICFELPMNSR